jgi:gliding motility-associated-like protein
LPNSYVAVYNRWGQKIFETRHYLNNWDGRTSTGEKVSNGTYFYVVIDSEGVEYTGYLSVSGQ